MRTRVRELLRTDSSRVISEVMATPGPTTEEIWAALEESVKLQSHYAELLNMHDGGERRGFKDAHEWTARLRELRNKH